MTNWRIDINWNVMIQVAVLAALVWAITRRAKKAPASWRHALWAIVAVKLLVPSFTYLPSQMVVWRRPVPVAATTAVSVSPVRTAPYTVMRESNSRDVNRQPKKPITKPSPIEAEQVAYLSLLVIWIIGVGVSGHALRRQYKKQKELIRSACAAEDALLHLLADCMSVLGVRKTPGLLLSDDVATPVLMGLRHPVILLPTRIQESCEQPALRAMLMHELAHMIRRDMLFIWLQQIGQVLYWAHPAVWLAGRELRKEAEIAADELVLARGGIPRKTYADGYVSALRLANNGPRHKISLAMAEPFDIESNRVLLMLREVLPRFTRAWVAGLVLLAAVVGPTFIGFASDRGTSKVDGSDSNSSMIQKTYYFRDKATWKWRDISVTVGNIKHSWPAFTKERRMPNGDMMLPSTESMWISCHLQSASGGWELDDVQVRANHGTLPLNGGSVSYTDGARAVYSAECRVPSRLIRALDLTGTAVERSSVNTTPEGPFSISQAKHPMVFPDQGLLVTTVNWHTGPLPLTYVYREPPYNRPHEFGPFADKASDLRANEPYLICRVLYTKAAWCSSSKPCDFVVYDSQGRAVPMKMISEYGDGSLSYCLPNLDENPELYLGMQVTIDYGDCDETPQKLTVSRLDPMGPAQAAGIKVGDVLTALNDRSIWDMHDFTDVSSYSESSHSLVPLKVSILRQSKQITLKVMPVWDPIWATYVGDIQNADWDITRAEYRFASHLMVTNQAYLYSAGPVPPDFQPAKLAFKVSSRPVVRKVRFEIRNIPLPDGFWDKKVKALDRCKRT